MMKKVFVLFIFFSPMLLCSPSMVSDTVLRELDGVVAIEAEHYDRQVKDEVRKWYLINADVEVDAGLRDDDEPFYNSASGKAYLEILPDTRTNHDEELIHGENFSNQPGILGILEYDIHFENEGRYYVWVRAHSTGSEDNGIHVGLDGDWPDSGRRMQWCEGKNEWTWASKQRTADVHCGVEKLIYLDIDHPGMHTIMFSMREDGFEFDKFVLSKEYSPPKGVGP